jgi:hypothetical protein
MSLRFQETQANCEKMGWTRAYPSWYANISPELHAPTCFTLSSANAHENTIGDDDGQAELELRAVVNITGDVADRCIGARRDGTRFDESDEWEEVAVNCGMDGGSDTAGIAELADGKSCGEGDEYGEAPLLVFGFGIGT